MVSLALELVVPWVVLGFSIGMEAFDELLLISITMNKASGGDRSPVELFQILKDDAVKVLHSICQ